MASYWPPQPQKKQSNECGYLKKKTKRQWIAHNLQCFQRVDVAKIPNAPGNDYLIYLEQEKLVDWKISYRGQKFQMDTREFFNIVEDTLVEYVPCGLMTWNTDDENTPLVPIRIKRIRRTPERHHKTGLWKMAIDIRLPKGIQLCERLSKVKLQIRSQLLPKLRYQYGYCNLIHSKYNRCSDKEYLTRPGNLGTHHKYKRCQVFQLKPGEWTPKIVCRFDVGT